MILNKLKIKGFRSIKKEEMLRVDDKITILIGANDHGKSNLLEAVLRLNDDRAFTMDDKNWDLPANESMAISWHFKVDDATLQTLKTLGGAPPAKTDVALSPEEQSEPAVTTETVTLIPLNTDNEIVYCRTMPDNVVKVESVPLEIPLAKAPEIWPLVYDAAAVPSRAHRPRPN